MTKRALMWIAVLALFGWPLAGCAPYYGCDPNIDPNCRPYYSGYRAPYFSPFYWGDYDYYPRRRRPYYKGPTYSRGPFAEPAPGGIPSR